MNGGQITPAATASAALVSQELYDETVLENADAFDLSPSEAAAETLEQFVKQCSHTNLPSLSKETIDALAAQYLGHLFLTHPESAYGRRDRARRGAFLKTLEYLDGRVDGDGGVIVEDAGDCEAVCDAVDSVRLCLSGGAGEVAWSKLKLDLDFETTGTDGDAGVGGGAAVEAVAGDDVNDDEEDDDAAEEGTLEAKGYDEADPISSTATAAEDGGVISAAMTRARAGLPYLTAFETHGAIFTLMSLLGCSGRGRDADAARPRWDTRVARASARCLTAVLRLGGPAMRDSFVAFDLTRRLLRTRLVEYIRAASGSCVHREGGGVDADAEAEKAKDGEEEAILSMSLWRDLLVMATAACRRCEKNKVMFMRAGLGPNNPPAAAGEGAGAEAEADAIGTSGVDILLSTLSTLSNTEDDDGEEFAAPASTSTATTMLDFAERRLRIQTEGCRLVAALCRYDDFRSESSSAVEHASTFHRAGAVPVLMKILTSSLTGTGGPAQRGEIDERINRCNHDLACASMAAVRVLAVNDDIVQSLVAAGLLKSIPVALERCGCGDGAPPPTEKTHPEDASPAAGDGVRLLAATLGAVRNLCGNDGVKTTLCNDGHTLPSILSAMAAHPDEARIQEHGCATLAAMALRSPDNALRILGEGGMNRVIVAMRRHPRDVPLQRQGCLAVRNVASRAGRRAGGDGGGGAGGGGCGGGDGGGGNAVREALLELGAERVLRDVAGGHRGSVDEACAALRDLGCEARLVQVEVGPDGAPVNDGVSGEGGGGRGVQMFGDVRPKFRHTFEESGGGGVGLMQERIARHAAASSSSSSATAATKGLPS